MTDISVETINYQVDDRAWLLNEAVGQQAPAFTLGQYAYDFTLFTASTHYPNGFLPSGLCLAVVIATQRLGPYTPGASNGLQTAVGFNYNTAKVPTNLAVKNVPALVDCFAAISVSKLPAASGLDSAARTTLALIKFRP